MDPAAIGCSLAEAAESDAYLEYLKRAATVSKSLHVVYINTSLRTKAQAHAMVPTITCTSSNVVQTILQAFAQVRTRNTLGHGTKRRCLLRLEQELQHHVTLDAVTLDAVVPYLLQMACCREGLIAAVPVLHAVIVAADSNQRAGFVVGAGFDGMVRAGHVHGLQPCAAILVACGAAGRGGQTRAPGCASMLPVACVLYSLTLCDVI